MAVQLIHVTWSEAEIARHLPDYEEYLRNLNLQLRAALSDDELLIFRPNVSREPISIAEFTIQTIEEYRARYDEIVKKFPILNGMQYKNVVVYPEASFDMYNSPVADALWHGDVPVLVGWNYLTECVDAVAQWIYSKFNVPVLVSKNLSYDRWLPLSELRSYNIHAINNPKLLGDGEYRKYIYEQNKPRVIERPLNFENNLFDDWLFAITKKQPIEPFL